MEENNIPNNIIAVIDCKGTCKTTEGCTCGNQKSNPNTSLAPTATKINQNACNCGKNPEGSCGCKTGKSCCQLRGSNKLEVYDWLADLPESQSETQMVEVQFKNTRKGYYVNSNNLDISKGDIVAVESTPGHDIGEVTLVGKLVLLQMKKNNYRVPTNEHKRVYRLAKATDIEKQKEAKRKEYPTMLRAREIAEKLELQMKISDVEYQGDGNKAIFYYIADERVDFRELIKRYAEAFHLKIEMKQIGARQEAGRVGGIGPCGRELCCSSSVSSFVSVSTSAARYQDISLNPQKLAGLCGKLKCCLNYEVDTYVEAQRSLPSREIVLDTMDGAFFHFKTDILSGMMTYSTDKRFAANLITLDKDRVFEIIKMNRNGKKPLKLENTEVEEKPIYKDILEQENITRFDTKSGNSKRKKKKVLKSPTGEDSPKIELSRKGDRPQNGDRTQNRDRSQSDEGKGQNKQRSQNNKPKPQKPQGLNVQNGDKQTPKRNNNPKNRESPENGEQKDIQTTDN